MGHQRWWWQRRSQKWGLVALPIAVLVATTTFTLAFAKATARPGTGAPMTGPQVNLYTDRNSPLGTTPPDKE